jgi:hypothetical protein
VPPAAESGTDETADAAPKRRTTRRTTKPAS